MSTVNHCSKLVTFVPRWNIGIEKGYSFRNNIKRCSNQHSKILCFKAEEKGWRKKLLIMLDSLDSLQNEEAMHDMDISTDTEELGTE